MLQTPSFSFKNLACIVFLTPLLMACQETNTIKPQNTPAITTAKKTYEKAVFAGGCFWCVEADFEKLPGVIEAISGYAGGNTQNPTYKQVTHGNTGHYEVAQITFDPQQVSYGELVEYFWRHVNPTDAGGQFCDRGASYRTAIFATPKQFAIAQKSKTDLSASKILTKPIITPIYTDTPFYAAEDYHQDYYKKNPVRYKLYRSGCGRDSQIKSLWK